MRARRALSRLGAVRTATLASATASSKRPGRGSAAGCAPRWRAAAAGGTARARRDPRGGPAGQDVGGRAARCRRAVAPGISGAPGPGASRRPGRPRRRRPARAAPSASASSSRPGYVDGRDGVGEQPLRRPTAMPGHRSAASAARACGPRVHGQVGDQPAGIDAQRRRGAVRGEGERAEHRDPVRKRLSSCEIVADRQTWLSRGRVVLIECAAAPCESAESAKKCSPVDAACQGPVASQLADCSRSGDAPSPSTLGSTVRHGAARSRTWVPPVVGPDVQGVAELAGDPHARGPAGSAGCGAMQPGQRVAQHARGRAPRPRPAVGVEPQESSASPGAVLDGVGGDLVDGQHDVLGAVAAEPGREQQRARRVARTSLSCHAPNVQRARRAAQQDQRRGRRVLGAAPRAGDRWSGLSAQLAAAQQRAVVAPRPRRGPPGAAAARGRSRSASTGRSASATLNAASSSVQKPPSAPSRRPQCSVITQTSGRPVAR